MSIETTPTDLNSRINSRVGDEVTTEGRNQANTAGRLRSYLPLLIFVDLLAITITGAAAKYIYVDFYLGSDEWLVEYLIVSIALAALTALFYEQMELYKSDTLSSPILGFGKLWGGLALAFLILLGLLFLLKISDNFSRGWMLTWLALSAIGVVLCRWQVLTLLKSRIQTGALRHSVAIYGTREFVTKISETYGEACPLSGISGTFVVSEQDLNTAQQCQQLERLRSAMQANEYDTIIIALPSQNTSVIKHAIESLGSYSNELLLCSDLDQYPYPVNGSVALGTMRVDVINVVPLSETAHIAKSFLDYTLATIGLILLSPTLMLIALAIKLDSKGPVFFRQHRYGQNNKIFRIFKFRTMTVEEDGPVVVQATRDDDRITRVGRFLRRTSLDELPQLINVLLGQMSIVGPRPHALAHDQDFETKLDLFSRRRRVRPGITGWAQVKGYRGETKTIADIEGRVQHDLYYIDNWSVWLDLEIIARTILVAGKKAY